MCILFELGRAAYLFKTDSYMFVITSSSSVGSCAYFNAKVIITFTHLDT